MALLDGVDLLVDELGCFKLLVLLIRFVSFNLKGFWVTLVALTYLSEICFGSSQSVNFFRRFLNIGLRHLTEASL